MKRVVCIMFLVTALVSVNVRALTWDPDNDADFKFNMDFESKDVVVPYTTTDSEIGLVGTVTDYNERYLFDSNYTKWDPNNFWNTANAIRGTNSGDFCRGNDKLWWGRSPNDVSLMLGGGTNYDMAIFDFGTDDQKRTYAFWFNDVDVNKPGSPDPDPPDPNWPRSTDLVNNPGYSCMRYFGESSLIRYYHRKQPLDGGTSDYQNNWWEIRVNNGRLEFRHGLGHLFMQTAKPLTELGRARVPDGNGYIRPDSNGCDPNTWHHAVIVIDKSDKYASKIYIDGIAAALNVINHQPGKDSSVDDEDRARASIGAATRMGPAMGYEFDGMLDNIRVYHRALTSTQANILYQWDSSDPNAALAIVPWVNEKNVAMNTGLQWDRYANGTGVTKQEVYFGTDPDNLVKKGGDLGSGVTTLANSALNSGNLLTPGTMYYWRVNSTVGGVLHTGTVWNFTTESGKAYNPVPADKAKDLDNSGKTDLSWSTTITDTSKRRFDVYFAIDPTRVADSDPNYRIRDDMTGNTVQVNTPTPGMVYYWRVNTYYTGTSPNVDVPGDVWQFRTEPYKLIFNTGPGDVNYLGLGHIIPSRKCHKKQGVSWVDTGVTGSVASDGVAIFNFSSFNYDSQYDIVVVPDYIPENDDTNGIPTPLAIHVAGNFYFDGMLDISGDNTDSLDSKSSPKARCGGHRGPRQENFPGDFKPELPLGYYYKKMEFESRWGDQRSHYYSVPTTINPLGGGKPSGYAVFGLGCSQTAPYKDSGGAGYGGIGGDSGRGWTHGIFAGGATYGDEEVPVPFGGSAASWSQHNSGGAGAGGVEIKAVNVTLGSNARILARGGTHPWIAAQYPSGGGSGGSVKIVADANFTNNGVIDVSGGKGQNGGEKGNNSGGGGGGGRVAVFYGGICLPDANGGDIIVAGGPQGVCEEAARPWHNGLGMSTDGGDGTIYVRSFTQADPRKASAPTPKDGDRLVYDNGSHQVTLKWYSGFGAVEKDRVFFGEVGGPNSLLGSAVTATRGQKSSAPASVAIGHSYYWFVKTDSNTVKSDVWEFSVVGWECNEPDYEIYVGQTLNMGNASMMMAAGWPSWDFNHDCIVNNEDLWEMAQYWQIDRGGKEYRVTMTRFEMFVFQWMTCRARTNNGCNGWEPCGDWVPPSDTGL